MLTKYCYLSLTSSIPKASKLSILARSLIGFNFKRLVIVTCVVAVFRTNIDDMRLPVNCRDSVEAASMHFFVAMKPFNVQCRLG